MGQRAPEEHEDIAPMFIEGDWFSAMPVDQAHEQTNERVKGKAGSSVSLSTQLVASRGSRVGTTLAGI